MAISLSFVKADRSSATIAYESDDINLPNPTNPKFAEIDRGIEWRLMERRPIICDQLRYEWIFSPSGNSDSQAGNQKITGLDSGKSYIIIARFNATYVKTTYIYQRQDLRELNQETGKWGPWIEGEEWLEDWFDTTVQVYENDLTKPLRVYTRPSEFQWSGNIEAGEIIEDELTANDWNLLRQIARQKKQWLSQSSETACGGSATKGAYITANIFNTVADYIGYSRNVEVGDEVKASYFIGLQTQVNKST